MYSTTRFAGGGDLPLLQSRKNWVVLYLFCFQESTPLHSGHGRGHSCRLPLLWPVTIFSSGTCCMSWTSVRVSDWINVKLGKLTVRSDRRTLQASFHVNSG